MMAIQFIPCAQNDNKGEQLTRAFLMEALANTDDILLGNYHLPVNNGTYECDLVLFNRRGIWIIEVKNWHGSILIDRVNWQRADGFIIHSPLISVETKAKMLASIVNNLGYKNISVVGLVVLSQPNATLKHIGDVNNNEPQVYKIFHLENHLIRALDDKNYLYKLSNRELSAELRQEIVKLLLPRTIDPRQQRIDNSYQILYELDPGPKGVFQAYKAKHVNIKGRFARAKKYYMPSASTTGELGKAIENFQRDLQALMNMEHHPNIVQVYDYQPDRNSSDTYWLLLEWIIGITLQDRLNNGPDISFQEQRRILNAVLDALDSCHRNRILHRNLTPSCIYLANDGTVKLGDFDFARVPDLSTTLTITGEPLPVQGSRYMAPELQINARAADERADLYALGTIWYDMIVRPEPDAAIDLSLLDKTELSPDAVDLLSRLVSPDPAERPKNAKAAKTWLEQV